MRRVLVAVVAALALTACSGDDDSGSDEPTTELTEATTHEPSDQLDALSKAEFVAQADAICEASDERIDEVEDSFENPDAPTEAEVEKAFTEVVIPEYRTQLDALRDLSPPSEDADMIAEMLDNLEQGIESLEEDWQSPDREAFDRANEIAADYGFQECGD